MARYIRARRTSATSSNQLNQLRDQFIRQLTRDAQQAMRQLTDQFNQDLERNSTDFMSGLLGGGKNGAAPGQGVMGLVSSATRYFFNRPHTTESTSKSTRSNDEMERFRVSQSQAMAEANAAIMRGEKNS